MSTVLILGASRGIGLEFVRQYRADGHRVIATARSEAGIEALQALGAEAHRVDLTDPAAVAGLGIALHSVWHVWRELESGQLEPVLPEFPLPETGIYAVMPQRRLMPPRVRAFIDFLEARFGTQPPWERRHVGR